ncbi:MAG: phosphopantothenoylcysteine decarboxylase [Spirochaetia bacterium]|nr:phosphopantothenoylcysteine decarboxylase [Spirochaetia bacterium]
MQRIVLGVTGGIAAYKAADLARLFTKAGVDVMCVMTREAREFITPRTMRTLTGNPVFTDMFHDAAGAALKVEHIDLARSCDLIVIAPATANIIGKIACGIADDLLTTVVMATGNKTLLAPAMNSMMWENPIVKANVARLVEYGYEFIGPKEGELACGEYGAGHIEDVEAVYGAAMELLKKKLKQGKKQPL